VVASPAPQLLFIISIGYLSHSKGAGSGPGIIKVIIKRKAGLTNVHVNFPSRFLRGNKTDLWWTVKEIYQQKSGRLIPDREILVIKHL
jgi:hypothetical protein